MTTPHEEIRSIIRMRVLTEWEPGAKIPSERELEKLFKASRPTISKALSCLVAEGLLERRKGSGTFVRDRRGEGRLIRFLYYLSLAGQEPYPGHLDLLGHSQRELAKRGYELLFSTSDLHDGQAAAEGLDVEGMIILGPVENDLILETQNKGIPLVLLDHNCPELRVDSVNVDNRLCGRLAAETLGQAGHGHIAYIGGHNRLEEQREWPASEERWSGVCEGLAAAGIAVRQEYHVTDWLGNIATENLLSMPEPPTAIILFSDAMIPSVLRTLDKNGISVPEDLSLISFGALSSRGQSEAWGRTSLVAFDWADMARTAVEVLMRRISKPFGPIQSARIAPVLTGLDSVAPPCKSSVNPSR